MRLLHYTEEPLAYDAARTYEQNEPRSFGKPKGLWVSVEGEMDWLTWCTENEFATYALAHVSEVTLAPDANVLMLDTVDAIVDFHDRYSVEDTGWLPPRHTFSEEYVWKSRPIDWTPITAVHGKARSVSARSPLPCPSTCSGGRSGSRGGPASRRASVSTCLCRPLS